MAAKAGFLNLLTQLKHLLYFEPAILIFNMAAKAAFLNLLT
jgi:hypothetical protein